MSSHGKNKCTPLSNQRLAEVEGIRWACQLPAWPRHCQIYKLSLTLHKLLQANEDTWRLLSTQFTSKGAVCLRRKPTVRELTHHMIFPSTLTFLEYQASSPPLRFVSKPSRHKQLVATIPMTMAQVRRKLLV